MDDLIGSAADRLAWLEERRDHTKFDSGWLMTQLIAALRELADALPAADAEREGRVDY